MRICFSRWACLLAAVFVAELAWAQVKIGFNYPATGPYYKEGEDELRGAEMAVQEINAEGGILGEPIELLIRDTKSDPKIAAGNARELYGSGATMIFGGVSSAVAIAVAKVAHEKNKLFFATLTYSMDTTGKNGFKTTFRECYDSWMAAQALGSYLRDHHQNKKYFYIVTDYTWGWTTEAALRVSTDTLDADIHRGVKTRFPGNPQDLGKAILEAKRAKPNILVLVLFGKDFTTAIDLVQRNKLKEEGVQIVAPSLNLTMAKEAGAEAMAGVLGTVPWAWQVPGKYPSEIGSQFVQRFLRDNGRHPSSAAAFAYTILHQYKAAVERANVFDTEYVITALEGHKYFAMKDEQQWREFDHQSVQSAFVVKGKPATDVKKDGPGDDYFEILEKFEGPDITIPKDLWRWQRLMAGKPGKLE